jgi:acyl-CoA reductase-like NAD-dependent aldehyde dehydrogenase
VTRVTTSDKRWADPARHTPAPVDTTAFAYRRLTFGGVIIGDVPSYRADQMPYGGVKGSGVGREGVASAMDDYTEPRVMVLTGVEL